MSHSFRTRRAALPRGLPPTTHPKLPHEPKLTKTIPHGPDDLSHLISNATRIPNPLIYPLFANFSFAPNEIRKPIKSTRRRCPSWANSPATRLAFSITSYSELLFHPSRSRSPLPLLASAPALTTDTANSKPFISAGLADFSFDVTLQKHLHTITPNSLHFLLNKPSLSVTFCLRHERTMNRRVAFWVLLLTANAAMWFVFVRKQSLAKSQPPKIVVVTNRAPAASTTAPVTVIRTNAFNWTQLESEDYRTYIARLRSIECPEQTIRDIVIADLEKLMAARVQEIEGHRERPKYWKPDRKELVRTVDTLEKMGQKQEVDFQKREIIRDLLGVDLAAERSRSQGEADFYEERLDFLTPEQRTRVRIIMERANRAEVSLREKSWLENDELSADERKELREIQHTKEQQVASLLSPDELDQYNLWFSPSAYRVRDSFFAMEPSEEDFLAVYKLQRSFDEQWQDVQPAELTPAEFQKYEQAQKDYEAAIREYLGEERYTEYQRSRDDDYQQLQAAASQFGLNLGVASEVYGYKKVLDEERTRVRSMPGLTSDQRNRVFDALTQEAEQSVVEVMGPKAYRFYIRSGAGKWISGK